MQEDNSQQTFSNQPNPQVGSVSDLNQPPPTPNPITDPTVVTSQKGKKFISKNIIASIAAVLILVGAVVAGVLLVGQQQNFKNKAAEDLCDLAPENCVYIETPGDSGSYKVDGIALNVILTDEQVRAFDPTVTEDGCYQVEFQEDTVYWNKVGTSSDCGDLLSIQVWLTQLPEESETTVQSQCKQIKIYDTDWNLLSAEDLQEAEPGDKIYLAVDSSTTQGIIDQAKFSVNGVERTAVSTKKPESNELFDEYTVPTGKSSFNVTVQLHHSEFGWF